MYIHPWREGEPERVRSCNPLYLSWLGAQSAATLLSLPPSLPPSPISSFVPLCPTLLLLFVSLEHVSLPVARRSQIVPPRSNVLHSHRKCPPSF